MRIGQGERGLGVPLAWLHVEHSRLEAGESLLLHAEAFVGRVPPLRIWVVVGAHGVGRGDEAEGLDAGVIDVLGREEFIREP